MKISKKCNLAVVMAILAMPVFAAPTVGRFLVRQQWPWHDKVEIEYTLSGVEGPTDVTCEVYDGETKLNIPESAFSESASESRETGFTG